MSLLLGSGGGGSSDNTNPTPNTPQNQAPTGSLTGDSTMPAGSSRILQLQASDEDGEIINIEWTVEGPLDIEATTDAFIQVRADAVGTDTAATVIARLHDDDEATTTLRHPLTVTPISTTAPTVDAADDLRSIADGEPAAKSADPSRLLCVPRRDASSAGLDALGRSTSGWSVAVGKGTAGRCSAAPPPAW